MSLNGSRLVRRVLVLVAVALLALGSPALVLATVTVPTTLAIDSVGIYRNTLAADDQLTLVYFHVCYGADCKTGIPTEPASTTFIIREFDSTGAEVGRTVPVVLTANTLNGYNYGVASIYFAPGAGPTWASAVTFTIEGNPTVSWSSTTPYAAFNAPIWCDSCGTLLTTQTALTNAVIYYAGLLSTVWNVGGVALTQDVSAGVKLSAQGETYFSGAIPNLRLMAPNVFASSVTSPKLSLTPYTQANATQLGNRTSGTMLDMLNYLGPTMGVSRWVVTSTLWIMAGLFIMWKMGGVLGSAQNTIFLMVPWLAIGSLLSLVWLGVTILAAAIGGIMLISILPGIFMKES